MGAFAPSMTVDTERRKKLRSRPRNLVYVELESANGGMMRDLSEEGFALRAMMPLRAGEKTQFAFSLEEATRISGEGRIVWIKEGGRVAGIEFCGIPHNARELIREWLGRTDQLTAQESKVPATSVPEPSTLEELPEEARFTLPRVALSSAEPPKAAPSSEPESVPAPIPVPPPVAQPPEEARFTLPRVALPSVEPPKAAPFSEPEIAHVAIPESVGIADLAEAPTGSATAPSPEMQTELHDILPETARATVLEPLPTESVIEPLPELQSETECSETIDEHSVSRSLLMRAIGMMLLLTLIAGGVVFHREVGHALIWVGQVIAGPEETPLPQSSVAEPPAQTSAVPETTGPVSSTAVSGRSATSSAERDGAGPAVTQGASGSKVIEVPPILPATPSSSVKTPSAPVLQPTSQQNRILTPDSSSGTASVTSQQEYEQAEEILRRKGDEVELPVAERLLWAALEKGNADAEVALAGLYRQGKGVAKNCEQARVLLAAAARKGSAEGRKHLEELIREGCQ